MASQTFIFDHSMHLLAEVDVPSTPRGWVPNRFGKCEFSMSLSDPKVTDQILHYGNLIFIKHIPAVDANGNVQGKLPDWVGIILPPRTWDEGVVHVTAYSAEAVLVFRPMQWEDNFTGQVLHVFRKCIDRANTLDPNIQFIYGHQDNKSSPLMYNFRLSAYDHIVTAVTDAEMYWNVTGEVVNDNLKLYANLLEGQGLETDMVMTSENTKMGSPLLEEQGTPANYIIAYSQANTPQTRITVEVQNPESVKEFGMLAFNRVFDGRTDASTVENAAQALVSAMGKPRKLFSRSVMDVGANFTSLRLGNILNIQENRVGFKPGGGFGFSARARIMSVDYNDLTDECPLNIEILDGE
jgi:hypothetical protein